MRVLTEPKIVLASHNKGKLREIQALLAPFGIACVSAGELGLEEPVETETSFAGNARLKAHFAAQAAGLQRFLYHPEPDIGAAEWLLISRMCGTAWDEDPKGYWPTGTDLPDTWNGGRPTPDEI